MVSAFEACGCEKREKSCTLLSHSFFRRSHIFKVLYVCKSRPVRDYLIHYVWYSPERLLRNSKGSSCMVEMLTRIKFATSASWSWSIKPLLLQKLNKLKLVLRRLFIFSRTAEPFSFVGWLWWVLAIKGAVSSFF